MAANYVCARCGHDCKTAGAFRRHQEKKRPCEPIVERVAHEAAAAAVAEHVAPPLKRAVMRARDILRSQGITGVDALDCIATLIFLRELPRVYPRLRDKATYVLHGCGRDAQPLMDRDAFLFEYMVASPVDPGYEVNWCANVRTMLALVGKHPDTAHIDIDAAKVFPLNDSRTCHELAGHIARRIQFAGDGDTLGAAYMSLLADMEMVGKEMGQFFTPAPVVALAVACAAQGRALGHAYDPTCGSGGFLAAAHNRGAIALRGTELDPRVIPIAAAHLTLLGARAEVYRADFLSVPNLQQHDTVLANPPFGVKAIKLSALHLAAPETVQQIPSPSKPTGFFLQRIIHAVKVGGRGVVVLPLGAELTGMQAMHTKLRERMLSVVNVREVVNFPSGTFENTTIKTALLVFDKVRELSEADAQLEIVNEEILFSDFDPANPTVPTNRLAIGAAAIVARGCSLDSSAYRQAMRPAAVFAANVEVRPLGELCQMLSGNYDSKDKQEAGEYSFYNAGRSNPCGFGARPSFVFPEYVLFVKDGNVSEESGMGRSWHMTTPACATSHVLALHSFAGIDAKYLSHYLNATVANTRAHCAKSTTSLGCISQARLRELPIPLPPLEVQQRLAAALDAAEARAKQWDDAAATLEEEMQNVLRGVLYMGGALGWAVGDHRLKPEIPTQQMGEVAKFTSGRRITKQALVPGDYPVVGGGRSPMGWHNECNTPANAIIVSRYGSAGAVSKYAVQVFLIDSGYLVESKTPVLSEKYLFYYLRNIEAALMSACKGMAQPGLDLRSVLEFPVPLPPIEVQRATAAQLDGLAGQVQFLRDAAAAARDRAKNELATVLAG